MVFLAVAFLRPRSFLESAQIVTFGASFPILLAICLILIIIKLH